MPELHQTIMGQRLIQDTFPEIAKQLQRIANALEDKKVNSDQVSAAYRNYVNQFPNDADLGKAIRALWQTNK